MPRPCSICSHPESQAMDQALQAGGRIAVVARHFAVSVDALARHTRHTRHTPAGYAPMARPALVDAAQRLHTRAGQVHAQTREVRSLHDPELLTRIEDIARLLLEVTGLLVELTTATAPQQAPPCTPGARTHLTGEAQRLHQAALMAYHPARVIELLQGITRVLVRLTEASEIPTQ